MPDQNKSEKATPHKRMEQKRKGNVFQSKDLISGIMILTSFTALRVFAGHMFGRFNVVLNSFINLGGGVDDIDAVVASNIVFELATNLAMLVLPLLAVAVIFGILLSMAQTRVAWSSELLKPKFSRLNPIEGIKNRMFSLKAFVELIKSILKVTAIVGVLYWAISSRAEQIPNLLLLDIPIATLWIGNTIFTVALYAGAAMTIIGIADFVYQWWEHERQLMMSKQEVKDEYKQLEGSPEVKMERERIRRQRARERMMNAVKEADVVVRNPEHFAVALRYNLEKDRSPVVIAKGRDFMAQQIIREAANRGIYTVENPPLARALYAAVGIDMEIPEQFWAAMVDIIAHVMEIKGHDLRKVSSDIEKMQSKRA